MGWVYFYGLGIFFMGWDYLFMSWDYLFMSWDHLYIGWDYLFTYLPFWAGTIHLPGLPSWVYICVCNQVYRDIYTSHNILHLQSFEKHRNKTSH
jgi:hypothetical protein